VTETTERCEHGMSDECEMCLDFQETMDDQATDDDWRGDVA
jgi:hypothetical protein